MLNIDLASASVNTAPYAERLAQAHTWPQEATGRSTFTPPTKSPPLPVASWRPVWAWATLSA